LIGQIVLAGDTPAYSAPLRFVAFISSFPTWSSAGIFHIPYFTRRGIVGATHTLLLGAEEDKINIARPSVRGDKCLDIGEGVLELVDAQRVIDGGMWSACNW
jgi:hypothetical protein